MTFGCAVPISCVNQRVLVSDATHNGPMQHLIGGTHLTRHKSFSRLQRPIKCEFFFPLKTSTFLPSTPPPFLNTTIHHHVPLETVGDFFNSSFPSRLIPSVIRIQDTFATCGHSYRLVCLFSLCYHLSSFSSPFNVRGWRHLSWLRSAGWDGELLQAFLLSHPWCLFSKPFRRFTAQSPTANLALSILPTVQTAQLPAGNSKLRSFLDVFVRGVSDAFFDRSRRFPEIISMSICLVSVASITDAHCFYSSDRQFGRLCPRCEEVAASGRR